MSEEASGPEKKDHELDGADGREAAALAVRGRRKGKQSRDTRFPKKKPPHIATNLYR